MTSSASALTSLMRNAAYGSETILLLGGPVEMRARFREALSRHGYQVVEAANLQHAHAVLEHLGRACDLILACTGSEDDGELAAWRAEHPTPALLALDPTQYRTEEGYDGELGIRIRLALEAARPSRTILIVDENEGERRMLAHFLEAAGYDVSEASGGKEASKILEQNPPELLLTEIVMDELDGLQLIQNVRNGYPDVAVIAMSGGPRADLYLYVARLLGAKGMLQKPLSMHEVLRLLREVQPPEPGE